MDMLWKSKIIIPRQLYIFKLEPTNSLSVRDLRLRITPDLDENLKLIQDSDKSHNDAQLTDILDLAEKFHLVLW